MPILYDDAGGHDSKSLGLDENAIEIFLDPGEYFVGDATFQVRTLLGSCVSTVLWHPKLHYGAVSHSLLASRVANPAGGIVPRKLDKERHLEGKYCDEALELMIRELQQANVPIRECQAKLFGGGNMFPNQRVDDRLNVGRKNGEAARIYLRSRGLSVAGEDMFGDGHREIILNLSSGEVWVRHVKPVVAAPKHPHGHGHVPPKK